MTLLAKLLLLGVVALAAAARLHGLTAQGIWYDEAAIITYAQLGLDQWAGYMAAGGGPVVGLFKAPAVFLLLKGWMALAGAGELALRLPFALVGVATVVPLYLLVARVVGRPAGLAAAALLALNPMHVYYSQQVSEYAPLVLAVTVSMLLWQRARQQRRVLARGSLALLGVNIATLLIHPVGLVAPLAQVALDAPRRRASLWLNLLPLAAWALMLALVRADEQLLQASLNWIPALSGALLLDTARQLSHGVMSHGGLVHEQLSWAQTVLLVSLGGLVIRGAASLALSPDARARSAVTLLLTWIALPVVALVGASLLVRNQWVPRYLLVALPALLALAGAGLAAIWQRGRLRSAGILAGATVAALLAHSVWQHHGQGGEGLREAAADLRRQARADDGVIISPDRLALPFGYHHDGNPGAWLERTLRAQRRVDAGARWLVTEFDAPRRHLQQVPGFARWLARQERVFVLAVVDWPADAHTASLLAHLRRRLAQRRVWFYPYGSAHLFLFTGPAKKGE